MTDFEREITRKAARYAKKLLEQAVHTEPQITAALQEIASTISAEIIGLEYRFKSEESLARKIAETSFKNIKRLIESNYTERNAIARAVEISAGKNNDALRYTFIFSSENYVFGFKQTLQKLKEKHFTVSENTIWNAWKNIGTLFDKGYRGINATIISSQDQLFELQFHTRSSYQLKAETHFLYEELRLLKTSPERKNEIVRELNEAAQAVKIPKGVKTL